MSLPLVSLTQVRIPHIPGQHGVVQGEEYIIHPGTCVAILQPASFDGPPQSIAEPELFRPLWLARPNPLHDRVDDQNIRRDLKVGVVSAQDLGYHRLTVHDGRLTHMRTHFVDDHPKSVTVRLPGRPIVFRFRHPKPFRVQKFRTHPPTSPPTSK